MVDKLFKYALFTAMVAIWLFDAIKKRRAGVKPDTEKARKQLDEAAENILGVKEKPEEPQSTSQ